MRKLVLIAIIAVVTVFGAVPDTKADDVTCFREFVRKMDRCSYEQTWWERSICGADAELELAGCVGEVLSPW